MKTSQIPAMCRVLLNTLGAEALPMVRDLELELKALRAKNNPWKKALEEIQEAKLEAILAGAGAMAQGILRASKALWMGQKPHATTAQLAEALGVEESCVRAHFPVIDWHGASLVDLTQFGKPQEETVPKGRPSGPRKKLGESVVEILKKNPNGVSIKELAERIGRKQSHIYVWYSNIGKTKYPQITTPGPGMLAWEE